METNFELSYLVALRLFQWSVCKLALQAKCSSTIKKIIKIITIFMANKHGIYFRLSVLQNYGSSSVSMDKLGLSELTPGPVTWNVEVFVQALKETVCTMYFRSLM